MNKIIYILCLHCLVFLFSCTDDKQQIQTYPYVEFVYMGKGIETCLPVTNPNDVWSNRLCLDTIITDSFLVDKFICMVDSLEDDTLKKYVNIRTVSVIHFSDTTSSMICLGDCFGIMVNNTIKKDNPKLFDLVNNILFDENGVRKLIRHSLYFHGDSDIINSPEVKKKIDECVERVRGYGEIYPGFSR